MHPPLAGVAFGRPPWPGYPGTGLRFGIHKVFPTGFRTRGFCMVADVLAVTLRGLTMNGLFKTDVTDNIHYLYQGIQKVSPAKIRREQLGKLGRVAFCLKRRFAGPVVAFWPWPSKLGGGQGRALVPQHGCASPFFWPH